jgi:hypothetical protein
MQILEFSWFAVHRTEILSDGDDVIKRYVIEQNLIRDVVLTINVFFSLNEMAQVHF